MTHPEVCEAILLVASGKQNRQEYWGPNAAFLSQVQAFKKVNDLSVAQTNHHIIDHGTELHQGNLAVVIQIKMLQQLGHICRIKAMIRQVLAQLSNRQNSTSLRPCKSESTAENPEGY